VSTLKRNNHARVSGKTSEKVRVMTRNISSSSWCKGSHGRTSRRREPAADCLKSVPRVSVRPRRARRWTKSRPIERRTPVGHAHEIGGHPATVHSEANAMPPGRKIVVGFELRHGCDNFGTSSLRPLSLEVRPGRAKVIRAQPQHNACFWMRMQTTAAGERAGVRRSPTRCRHRETIVDQKRAGLPSACSITATESMTPSETRRVCSPAAFERVAVLPKQEERQSDGHDCTNHRRPITRATAADNRARPGSATISRRREAATPRPNTAGSNRASERVQRHGPAHSARSCFAD